MNTTSSRPKGFFLSLRQLLLITFTLLLTVILAAICYWFYTFATRQAMAQVKQDLQQALETAASNVDGDALWALSREGEPNAAGIAWYDAQEKGGEALEAALAQYGPPNQAGFSDDPRYRQALDWLDVVHRIEPRAWPYLWANGDTEGEIISVVDLGARYDPAGTPLFLEIGSSPWVTGLEFSLDSEGNLASYTDEWGTWYSAWAPIYDAGGSLVGGVGIDFEAGVVEQIQAAIRNTIVIAFGVTYLVLFAVIFTVSRAITRPIAALTKAAENVGEGRYDQDFASLSRGRLFYNEIGILSRMFGAMADKVYQREQTLRRQVEELRIEIDQAKRKKHVSEIVESDFFQDLQGKARQMRRRTDEGAPGGTE